MNMFNCQPITALPDAIVLAVSGPGPLIYGPTSNAVWFDLMKPLVLPAGTIQPGAVLEFDALFDFQGANAGRALRLNVNAASIGQSFPTTTNLAGNVKFLFYVANDGKSLLAYSQNFNDVLSPTAGQGAPFSVHTSAAPNVVVDLTGAVTVSLQARPQNGDSIRILGLSLVQRRMAAGAGAILPANAVSCWGDSLTAGTGSSSPSGGYVTRLRQALTGRGVSNLGIGGQTSLQIVDRMLADKSMGRRGIIVSWIGRNDVGISPDLQVTVLAQHARAVANLEAGTAYLPCTITPSATETTGTSNHTAILAANAALKAMYPVTCVDLYAALSTEPDGTIPASLRFDAVHLNDAGYEVVKTTVQAKLTSLGL